MSASLQPVTVDLTKSLTGSLGSQAWGGLTVSAKNASGAAALVIREPDGLGVAGGRFAGQVDYDPVTHTSETLRLDFAAAIDAVTVRLARMTPTEAVNRAEVGAWQAYNAAGVMVAEGILDPRGKTPVGTATYDFTIDPAVDFQRIELTARPYNNDRTLDAPGGSSDFSLAAVTYRPAGVATAGLVITESGGSTAVTEGGATDTLTVALATQPTANVTVTIAGDADVAGAATLTFTPQNWNVAQSVVVAAVNDTLQEAAEAARLTIRSSSTDAAYAGLQDRVVNVAVTDNDSAPLVSGAVTVGSAAALTGALGAQSWGGLLVSAQAASGAATLVTKTADGLGVTGGRFAAQIDYDTASRTSEMLRLNFGTAVDSATLRIGRLNPAEPAGQAEVGAWRAYDVAGGLVGEGLLDPRGRTAVANLTYDFVVNPAADFHRIELTARPYNNDATSGATYESSDFSLAQVSYIPRTAPPQATAALVVTESGGSTAVTEGGAGDSVTVALASKPLANVTVAVTGDADLVAGATLTFTPLNWNQAQTVTVGAVNDTLVEGAETAKLTFDASSADAQYGALPNRVLNVAVADNDTMPSGGGAPAGAVVVKVGADIQALVNANPAGTVFWIEAGEHRLQSITPKDGQHFIGADGAILNGSRELTGFSVSGNTWFVDGQTQEGARRGTGEATSGFSRAGYPDAVFLDDKPLLHVGSVQEVRPGTYFFDYAADRIYIGDNPAGHQVEAAVRDAAFKGSATGVTIENLVIEKYATPAQFAAIGGSSKPVDWLIKDNEVRLNYGVGIQAGENTEVIGNFIHDNGQMGVGASGKGVRYEANEIAENGFWSGLNVYWEGGGSKFANTDGLIVRGNYVHDNNGMGLWTDINNIRTLYEGNRVENNSGAGISHEISYSAIIRNNTLAGNGEPGVPWIWDGAIQIQNSSNVEVYGNTVDISGGGNGITMIQQNRGSGTYGPWVTTGNHVHDNIVVNRTGEGRSGAVADYDWAGLKAGGNLFDNNEYRFANLADDHFAFNSFLGWNAYRTASGWDANSELVLI
ncbi:right-handed parallel beta-helix repeat-containing protein [Falsiroseomonas oryzae]|uniref:right-handed parallel beta-helix repeat-containing protein n=1 Tax=Falsiroseomonas oryzae TaxID=2766473 RepID=UPI0022EB2980|nr:right-handed parallel beta-helix repeat-containing protein [Roseomonas sp. MO-31]